MAWREPVQPDASSRSSSPGPTARRPAELPLYTNFRSGARILRAADAVIAAAPRRAAPRPRQEARARGRPNGEGEVELAGCPTSGPRRRGSPPGSSPLHADDPGATRGRASRCCAARAGCSCSLQDALREAGIPAEFVGLAGLVKLPEVVEVLAYARAVADPYAGVALARILLGPRYRVGFKDLARVAAWAKDGNYGACARTRTTPRRRRSCSPRRSSTWTRSRASPRRAARRLDEFRDELASLRDEARRPVRRVPGATSSAGRGCWPSSTPSLDRGRGRDASSATWPRSWTRSTRSRRWRASSTLRAFLDYVDAGRGQPTSQEWSPVQPSDDDSVKVMTIHQAKGLEFDTVFVPGLATGILPDPTIQHNPAERGKSLDFELRGDAAILPSFDGDLKTFCEASKDQEMIEERRTVLRRADPRAPAAVRDRRALVRRDGQGRRARARSSRSWPTGARRPGWRAVDRGDEPARRTRSSATASGSSATGRGRARPDDADDAVPGGLAARGGRRHGRGGPRSRVVGLDGAKSATLFTRERRAAPDARAHTCASGSWPRRGARDRRVPTTVSVGGAHRLRPVPEALLLVGDPPPAAVQRPRGPRSAPSPRVDRAPLERARTRCSSWTSAPDLTPEELAGEPGKVERLRRRSWRAGSPDASRCSPSGRSCSRVDGHVVSGRIDAIFGAPDGGRGRSWTTRRAGGRTEATTRVRHPARRVRAGVHVGVAQAPRGPDPHVLLPLVRQEVSHPAGDPDEVRARVAAWLRGIAEGAFDPTPGRSVPLVRLPVRSATRAGRSSSLRTAARRARAGTGSRPAPR